MAFVLMTPDKREARSKLTPERGVAAGNHTSAWPFRLILLPHGAFTHTQTLTSPQGMFGLRVAICTCLFGMHWAPPSQWRRFPGSCLRLSALPCACIRTRGFDSQLCLYIFRAWMFLIPSKFLRTGRPAATPQQQTCLMVGTELKFHQLL